MESNVLIEVFLLLGLAAIMLITSPPGGNSLLA